MTKLTAVLSILSSNQMSYSHFGIIKEGKQVAISDSHRTKEYKITEFTSEEELTQAVFEVVKNRSEILKNVKAAKTAYSIEIEARIESGNSTKRLFQVKL